MAAAQTQASTEGSGTVIRCLPTERLSPSGRIELWHSSLLFLTVQLSPQEQSQKWLNCVACTVKGNVWDATLGRICVLKNMRHSNLPCFVGISKLFRIKLTGSKLRKGICQGLPQLFINENVQAWPFCS